MEDGGAAMAPLTGARVRLEPHAAPSSGSSVVPFWGPRERTSGIPAASGGSSLCCAPANGGVGLSHTTAVKGTAGAGKPPLTPFIARVRVVLTSIQIHSFLSFFQSEFGSIPNRSTSLDRLWYHC